MRMVTTPFRETARVASWFHAMSDVTRLHIIDLLAHKERCVCELEQSLDISQPRISFHLGVLKKSGLVKARRDGRWIYYALAPAALEQIATFTRSMKPGKRPDRCSLACCQ